MMFATSRISELTSSNDEKDEKITAIERECFKVLEENDRFRRQLGSRYGADGKTHNQLESLQKEFNAILEENRELKKSRREETLATISEGSMEPSGPTPYSSGGVSGSTLTQLREEYEEYIQALNDEKRELVMRNSAAINDVQKAEQRSWELEKQVLMLKEELTSTQLAVQRAERFVEEHSVIYHEETVDENNYEPQEMLIETSFMAPSPNAILSPSNRTIAKKPETGSAVKFDLLPIKNSAPLGARAMPSLMDMTQMSDSPDAGQPECKQS